MLVPYDERKNLHTLTAWARYASRAEHVVWRTIGRLDARDLVEMIAASRLDAERVLQAAKCFDALVAYGGIR